MKAALVAVLICIGLVAVAAKAPLHLANPQAHIKDQYIVVLNRDVSVADRDAHVEALRTQLTAPHTILSTFDIGTFVGFSAILDKKTVTAQLAHPNVRYIEADQIVTLTETDSTDTQSGATWGIDRISQVSLPLNGNYEYFNSGGAEVDAYIIDTGILTTHNEFSGGRAVFGANFVTGGTNEDCNGHGTHVAGTVGGKTYGVAKKTTVIAVKVLDCVGSGAYSGVVSGVVWVTKSHGSSAGKRSVANMSLGGGISTALDEAVAASISAGVVYAIAAGNSNVDACTSSPARVASGITVGATTKTDARATYSNYGKCLDIFAPGSDITSAWIGSNSAIKTISGTSMASPHVAGAAVIYLGHLIATGDTTVPTPKEVTTWMNGVSTSGKVTNPGTNSPNLLLYSPSA